LKKDAVGHLEKSTEQQIHGEKSEYNRILEGLEEIRMSLSNKSASSSCEMQLAAKNTKGTFLIVAETMNETHDRLARNLIHNLDIRTKEDCIPNLEHLRHNKSMNIMLSKHS
jgi:hypothetical protein